jgi:hypothetical protein
MDLRRKLFWIWCGVTIIFWLSGILDGDGSRIALKFQVGGWRAGYLHLAIALVVAVGIPLMVLLFGRAAFWIRDQFARKRTETFQD